ncbi:MAG: glycerol-3-phosphate dehydrogenase/oxidase [Alphaproteobacteria bacterium]
MALEGLDLLVVGGGITGAGVVRDAAMRGLRVGLVERGDFASVTSSRSAKLIHCGVRYLEQGEIALVREAAVERSTLRRIAPHLAVRAHMVMPVHGRTSAGLLKLRAGLWAYEKLVQLEEGERHETWDREETIRRVPGIEADRLHGAAVFTEYVTDDARLVVETLKSARRHGARLVNHAPLVSLDPLSNGAMQATVRDETDGREASFVCAAVVNAAGPWVDSVRRLGGAAKPRMHLTKGIHLVVSRERLPIDDVLVMRAADRRSVFIVPHDEIVWIGTTDTDYPEPVERPTIGLDDVDYLLEATNRILPTAKIGHADVSGAWAGVRPLLHQEGKSPSEISRRDEVMEEPGGLLSIAGGKLTTYRVMAERVVDQVVARHGFRAGPCRTADEALLAPGDRVVPPVRTTLSDDDVRHAVQEECALDVADVLERRSRINLFAHDQGRGDVERVAAVMAGLLGWDGARQAAEVGEYRARVAEDLAWKEAAR